MNILIKDMEMPRNCYFCWLGHKYPKYESLLWNKLDKKRKADCPLVEIPPHGRLIDADALMNSLPMEYPSSVMAINNAPTIIEAEEGET